MIKITEDLFDIGWRLRSIDADYELLFNPRLSRYEVWARGRLQVVCRYSRPDARLLLDVKSTRVEYVERVLSELERQNARLEKKAEDTARDKRNYKIKSLVSYLDKGGKALPNYDEI
jgi:hypothetical protein